MIVFFSIRKIHNFPKREKSFYVSDHTWLFAVVVNTTGRFSVTPAAAPAAAAASGGAAATADIDKPAHNFTWKELKERKERSWNTRKSQESLLFEHPATGQPTSLPPVIPHHHATVTAGILTNGPIQVSQLFIVPEQSEPSPDSP